MGEIETSAPELIVASVWEARKNSKGFWRERERENLVSLYNPSETISSVVLGVKRGSWIFIFDPTTCLSLSHRLPFQPPVHIHMHVLSTES